MFHSYNINFFSQVFGFEKGQEKHSPNGVNAVLLLIQ